MDNEKLEKDYKAFLKQHGFKIGQSNSEYSKRDIDKIKELLKTARPLPPKTPKAKAVYADAISYLPLGSIFDQNKDFKLSILEHVVYELRNNISLHSYEKYLESLKIYPGYFPTRDINALAAKVPNGYLGLINDGYVSFMMQMCNLVVAGSGGYLDQDEVAERISCLVFSYLFNQAEHIDLTFPGGGRDTYLSFMLFYGTVKYVLSHEFAHIIQGHLKQGTTHSKSLKYNIGSSIEILEKSWDNEFEADRVGFEVFLGYPQSKWKELDSPYTKDMNAINIQALSPFIFFMALKIEAQAAMIFKMKVKDRILISQTHPSAEHRLNEFGNLYIKLPMSCIQMGGSVVYFDELTDRVIKFMQSKM